jgi:rhamnosyl/mannosyltransferase
MRILVIGKFYTPFRGGIEEVTQITSEYAARQHDVTVLVNNHEPGEKTEIINGVRVIRRNQNFFFKGQPISFAMFRGIRFSDYDLINLHSPNPFASALFLVCGLGRKLPPVVVTHHMDIFGRKLLRAISLPFVRHIVRRAAAVIVTSRKNLEVSRDLPRDANYQVVPLGIKAGDYVLEKALVEDAGTWRRNLCGQAPLIGFVGRIARYKGLGVLLHALVELEGVHAVIGGTGEYLDEIKRIAGELAVADRVHFLESISHEEKLRLLAAIDVFAFPSNEITEAFGLSQVEAMICGVPVVATDLPTGVTDVSIDGVTALLAKPGDPVSFAACVRRMLADPALARGLAEKAKVHVVENLTADKVSARTLDVFHAATG